MTTPDDLQQIADIIRDNRSNESNFKILDECLQKAIAAAEKQHNTTLHSSLKEVQEKYGLEYMKAKETRDSAWPEFENFVTQFERSISAAK